jgi:hypothetical protein
MCRMAQFLSILLATVLEALRRLFQKVLGTPPKPVPVRVPGRSFASPLLSRLCLKVILLPPITRQHWR